MMTVLSASTIAMSIFSPTQIEIWDWRLAQQLRILTWSGAHTIFGHARLSDGRLVVGSWAGSLRIGSLDNWDGASVVRVGSGITGVLAGQDGSFVTTDCDGFVKRWVNGLCEATLVASCDSYFHGVPLAVAGSRLVVTYRDKLLVSDSCRVSPP